MDTVNKNSEKSVFVISKDTFFLNHIKEILIDFPDFDLIQRDDVNLFLDQATSMNPYLFLIDGNLGQNSVQEWTQILKMNFEKTPLVVFHSSKTPLNFESIKKNGTDLLIHLTFDKEFIIELLLEVIPYEFPDNQIPLSALSLIDSTDLNIDLEVNFDVFVHLPSNKKTIRYRKKGDKLDDDKLKKIEKRDQHLYFKKTEKKQFLEYARTVSTMSNADNPIAATEKALRTKKLIFQIMTDFFDQEAGDFKSGRLIFDRCKEIALSYDLLKPHSPEEAFAKIVKFTGQERTFYNEAINLAVYGAMFGHLLNLPVEQVESLALAGLLHNIGLSELEHFNLQQEVSTLDTQQLDIYTHYPEKSVWMIRNKRVPLPQDVSDVITEHRENNDGSGFPNKINGDRIKSLSRILRLAYEFQIMTALSKNQNKKTASSAMLELKENVVSSKLALDLNTVLSLTKTLNLKEL